MWGDSAISYVVLLVVAIIGSLATTTRYRKFELIGHHYVTDWSASQTVFFVIFGIIGILACVKRPDFMPDYNNYRLSYFTTESKRIESSFSIIKSYSPDFETFLLIYATISISIKLIAIRLLSPNIFISLLAFLSISFVLHDMIQIRASVAIALCLLSIKYIVEKNLKVFIILMATAFVFHYSSLVFFPMWFLNPQRINKSIYWWILPASAILFLIGFGMGKLAGQIPIMEVQRYFDSYNDNDRFASSTFGPRWIIYAMLGMYCVRKASLIQQKFPYAIITLKIYIFSLASFLLFMDIPVMSGRLSEFLKLSYILFFPMLPLACNEKKRQSILALLAILLLSYEGFSSLSLILYKN